MTAAGASAAADPVAPLVGIVMLNWNGLEDTTACLESLRRTASVPYRVVLVDNGSDEEERRLLRQIPDITLIENEENLGFTRANNAGIREALARGCTHVLLLNNDTIVDEQLLAELLSAVDEAPEIGIAAPKIYYFDHPDILWFAGGRVDFWRGDSAHIGIGERDAGQYDHVRDVDYVTACAMLVKRAVFEDVGELDPAYFIYFDETDFCVRARRAGYRLVLAPRARLLHKVSGAMGSGSANFWFHFTRSRVIFLRKHASALQKATAAAWFLLVDVPRMNVHFLRRGKLDCFGPFFRAIGEGLRYPVAGDGTRTGIRVARDT